MALSSPFAEPYFPLDAVDPDTTNVPDFAPFDVSVEDEANEGIDREGDPEISEDPDLDNDSSRTTIMLKLVPGLRVYVEPRVATVATKLLHILQAKTPNEIMDDFQMNVMGAIEGQQQERVGKGALLEVKANLSAARLRVCLPREDGAHADTVDVSLDPMAFLMRQSRAPQAKGRQENLAFHVTLAALGVSLHEGIPSPLDSTALFLDLQDLTAVSYTHLTLPTKRIV